MEKGVRMKKFLLSLFIFAIVATANAQNIFSDINSIGSFKCTGNIINGSINEYDNSTLHYTFKNGKLYSSNLNILFGDVTKKPKKVLKLKISDDYITFKERLYKFEGSYYIWIKINRETGEYLLNAKNDYGFFFKRANVKGICSIEN